MLMLSKKNMTDLKSEVMKLLYLHPSNFLQKDIKILQAKASLF